MRLQLGIPLFFVCTLLQATVLSRLRVLGGQPDLIVVLVLAWAILDRDREGMIWAFVGGLFIDLLSGAPLGISSLVLVPITYLVGLTETQVYRTNVLLPLFLTLSGGLAYHIVYLALLRLLIGQPVAWSTAIWYVTVPSIIFDMVLIIPFLCVLGRWYDGLHPRRVKI
ncbi:MAG: rod shape-determining protein MreD [Candidatus Hadarchaeum sp.]